MIIGHFVFRRKWLHNAFACKVEYRGRRYRSVDHAFNAIKSRPTSHDYVANAPSASEAWYRGLNVQAGYWTEAKLKRLMLKLLQSKFSLNPRLRDKMENTYPHELMFGNMEGDVYWGIDRRTGIGRNYLGILLMTLRDMIRLGIDHKIPLMKAAKLRRNRAYFARKRDRLQDLNLGVVVYPLPKITGATRAEYHPADAKRKREAQRPKAAE